MADLKRSRGGPRTLNLFSAFLLGQIGAHREQKKIPRPGRFPTSSVVVCYVISLAYVLTGVLPGLLFGDVDMANGGLRDPKHMGRAESPRPRD